MGRNSNWHSVDPGQARQAILEHAGSDEPEKASALASEAELQTRIRLPRRGRRPPSIRFCRSPVD